MTGYRDVAPDPWAWWYRLCVITICAVFVGIGTALTFGPQSWERSNSLQVIHDFSHIPWPAWGIGFYLGAVLIAVARTRKIGYLLSAGVVALFVGASVIWTVLPGKTTNPIVIGCSILSVLMLIAGARYVTQQEADQEVKHRLDDGDAR